MLWIASCTWTSEIANSCVKSVQIWRLLKAYIIWTYMNNISMWMWPCRTNFISVQMRGAQVLNFPHEHSNTHTHTLSRCMWDHLNSSRRFENWHRIIQHRMITAEGPIDKVWEVQQNESASQGFSPAICHDTARYRTIPEQTQAIGDVCTNTNLEKF